MLTPKDNIDQNRFNLSKAGKLISELISKGLLTDEDLNNPDIVDLINNSEPWSLKDLDRGDEVYFLDTRNPRFSMTRGNVIYAGMIQELGYNDKTLVQTHGIRIQGQPTFVSNTIERLLNRILQRQIELTFLTDEQRIFRRINEATTSDNPPFQLAEA